MIRTHEAGTLRAAHAGEHVVLAGWVARRRDHGGVVFIDLRDASGVVQVVWRGEEAVAHDLRAEFCVQVTGTVRARPAGNENPELPTGEIEVVADEVEVLSEADPLPFPVEAPPRSARTSASSTGTWTSGATTRRAPCGSGHRLPTCSPM